MMLLLSAMLKPHKRVRSSMAFRSVLMCPSGHSLCVRPRNTSHTCNGPAFTTVANASEKKRKSTTNQLDALGTTEPWMTWCSELMRGGLVSSSVRSFDTRSSISSIAFSIGEMITSRFATISSLFLM